MTLARACAQLREVHETLREIHAEELDEGEEEYPPGPAQLTAADPEVMPSEMEAMDDLQRTLKVGHIVFIQAKNACSEHQLQV